MRVFAIHALGFGGFAERVVATLAAKRVVTTLAGGIGGIA